MKTIDDVIDALFGYYDEGEKLDRGMAEIACAYLELLRDLMNDSGYYIEQYRRMNQ